MRLTGVWIVLVLSLGACAGQRGAVAVAASAPQPQWQQQMEKARRFAATGMNYVLVVTPLRPEAGGTEGGVYVFYNNPTPFCYTYLIPGEWVGAREPNAYRSKDGEAFVGVRFLLASQLEGVAGATLVERAANRITQEYEKALGQPLPGAELVPFEPVRLGAWRWRAAQVIQAERAIVFPVKIVVDIRPGAVVQITVQGTADDDGLARRIIESLRTTSDPECYWPVLEKMLKAADGNR